MAKGILKEHYDGSTGVWLYTRVYVICPACRRVHGLQIKAPEGSQVPCWGFNGNFDRPTFTPSLNVLTGKIGPDGKVVMQKNSEGKDEPVWVTECHSFITDGIIDYLGDCMHNMRGKVELPDIPEDHWLNQE